MENTALISDIHGNSPALKAVLNDIDSHGVKKIYVLGDVINTLDPKGCCDLLIDRSDTRFIKGNGEDYICFEGLQDFPWQNRDRWSWIVPEMLNLRKMIGKDYLDWIKEWPEVIKEGESYMVHDSPLDRYNADKTGPDDLPSRFYRLYNHGKGIGLHSDKKWIEDNISFIDNREIKFLIFGHSHHPFVNWENEKVLINAGSVGLPLDGDNRACWIHMTGDNILIRRVEYEIDKTIELTYQMNSHNKDRDAFRKMIRFARHWRFFL